MLLAGTAALFHSLGQLHAHQPPLGWLLLAGVTVLSASFTVKVPSISATLSVSETFVFMSVLLFGSGAATVTVALEALVTSSWRHRRDVHKVLFNATEPVLSIWVASVLFSKTLANVPATQHDLSTLVLPVIVLCSTYFILNSFLTTFAICLETRTDVFEVWRTHFSWLWLNYLAAASAAVLIVHNSPTVGLTTIGIVLPLLLVSYLTLKTSMGRVADANAHVDEVNKLYLSTIETLAMAVDAKDQVTHGHIRRVQDYAMKLAAALGLKDPLLLKAIEASALLHDMGKLAVPEFILNKPGKLTEAEFEQMKLHAAAGADILSAIQFPYPVVPIVRHHHENWNGTGYPDGLAGQDIPIGARILSVVDCFDALTSDRPYRKQLSDDEAITILTDRRGVMYDPLIVDAFIKEIPIFRNEEALEHVKAIASPPAISLKKPERSIYRQVSERRRANTKSEAAIEWLDECLAECFPSDAAIVFLVNADTNTLEPARLIHCDESLATLRIPLGLGVSGWVAAHKRTVSNSDAKLDISSDGVSSSFIRCMSTPLLDSESTLIGVVTIYRGSDRAFENRDVSILKAIANTHVENAWPTSRTLSGARPPNR